MTFSGEVVDVLSFPSSLRHRPAVPSSHHLEAKQRRQSSFSYTVYCIILFTSLFDAFPLVLNFYYDHHTAFSPFMLRLGYG